MATAQDGKQCQCMILLWRMLQITLLRAYSRSPTHCFLTNFEKSLMQKPRSAPNELFLNFINCFSLAVVIRSVRYVWIGDCYNVKTNSFMFHRTCGRILNTWSTFGVFIFTDNFWSVYQFVGFVYVFQFRWFQHFQTFISIVKTGLGRIWVSINFNLFQAYICMFPWQCGRGKTWNEL